MTKLSIHNSPYIRMRESSRTVMSDVMIALAPLYFMAYFYYGPRVLMISGIAITTCVLTDGLCSLMMHGRANLRDLSPIVTGMILSLFLPAAIDYWIVLAASLFAILVAKAPFGGTGNNLFNPAAAGLAFAIVSWPERMFRYTPPLEHLPLILNDTIKFVQGPAATLKLGGAPSSTLTELLLGNFPGPLGTTNVLIVLACFAYLLTRRNVKWYVPTAYLSTAALIAAFVRPYGVDVLEAICYELTAGSLLFLAIFMLPEPVSAPKRNLARLLYAAGAGVMTMLFRYFGAVEQSAVFALLLMNALSPAFDSLAEFIYSLNPKNDRLPFARALKTPRHQDTPGKEVGSIASHQKP